MILADAFLAGTRRLSPLRVLQHRDLHRRLRVFLGCFFYGAVSSTQRASLTKLFRVAPLNKELFALSPGFPSSFPCPPQWANTGLAASNLATHKFTPEDPGETILSKEHFRPF